MNLWRRQNEKNIYAIHIKDNCYHIGGAFIGYDVGDKMVTINHVISYQFSVIDALIVWFMSFAIGVLFLAIAKIIDLLEGQ